MYSTNRLFDTNKLIVSLLAIILTAIGCVRDNPEKNSFTITEGDLFFQDIDCGQLCDAIEKVTTGFNGANLSHVGIIAKNNDSNFIVIEAVSDGVQATPLQTFLNRSFDVNNQPKVIVGRLKPPFRFLIPLAIKEAIALQGKPYDKVFAIDNNRYYCSELIYEIFLRANGNKPVFKLQPMTFAEPDTEEIMLVWKEYFAELDVPVPQGQLGINPGGISCSPALTIVHIYGIPDGFNQ